MKLLKKVVGFILFVLGFDGEERRQYVDMGLLDLSGQGRDEHGK